MALRDLYSGLAFFMALPTDPYSQTAVNGTSIDLKGYDGCVFLVNIGSFTAVLTNSHINVRCQLGTSNAAGAVVWANVAASQVLHSIVGEEGAYSTITSGIVLSIVSTTDSDTVMRFGIRNIGEARWARVVHSMTAVGAEKSVIYGATAVLGYPHAWPVDAPVGINAPS